MSTHRIDLNSPVESVRYLGWDIDDFCFVAAHDGWEIEIFHKDEDYLIKPITKSSDYIAVTVDQNRRVIHIDRFPLMSWQYGQT